MLALPNLSLPARNVDQPRQRIFPIILPSTFTNRSFSMLVYTYRTHTHDGKYRHTSCARVSIHPLHAHSSVHHRWLDVHVRLHTHIHKTSIQVDNIQASLKTSNPLTSLSVTSKTVPFGSSSQRSVCTHIHTYTHTRSHIHAGRPSSKFVV